MKKLLVILFLLGLTAIPTKAQESVKTDSVTISQSELNKFFESLDTIREESRLQRIEIRNLNQQILNLKYISQQDSLLFFYKDRQIALLREEILLHEGQLRRANKSNWINYIWFTGGAVTLYISSVIVNNVEN